MRQQDNEEYLREHQEIDTALQAMFAAVIVDRPDDQYAYLIDRLKQMQTDGVRDWQQFIYAKHPYRDLVRLNLIRDGSVFQREHQRNQNQSSNANIATSDNQYNARADEMQVCMLLRLK